MNRKHFGISPTVGVSEFIAYLNQTLEVSFPYIEVVGELSNLQISKNKWVYFDIKDATAKLKCFATVHALPGPLEDGMMVVVGGTPRLHPRYNFSFQTQFITPSGEGSIKKAADLLAAKLAAEGLFDTDRKRELPFAPQNIALITSSQSAAYADFMKITEHRWVGLHIQQYDVAVQGVDAVTEICSALEEINRLAKLPEAIVIIRGGGSADDLAAFQNEQVVRAVAASRVPTVVAIGHESDISLAELAADVRASTPSNAAELLVPDKRRELEKIQELYRQSSIALIINVNQKVSDVAAIYKQASTSLLAKVNAAVKYMETRMTLIDALDPIRPLHQGYALVRQNNRIVTSVLNITPEHIFNITFYDGAINARFEPGINKEVSDETTP